MNILVNGYISLNIGDDLFFKILFERYPDVNFWMIGTPQALSFIGDKFPNVHQIYIKPNLLARVINKLFINGYILESLYKKIPVYIDYIVNIGGSVFINEVKQDVSTYSFIHDKIKQFFPSAKRFYIGCNFGPFVDPLFLEYHTKLFATIEDVCFRDKYSTNLFKHLSTVRCAPDVVFNLNAVSRKNKLPNSIGISLIEVDSLLRPNLNQYAKDYYQSIANVAESALNDKKIVRLFSFCRNEGDERAINKVLALVDFRYRANIEVVRYSGDIDFFLSKFQEMDILISTRFHAMILGLIFNQKVFPIIYSKKMTNVLDDLNYQNDLVQIEDIDSLTYERLIKNSNRVSTNIEHYSADAIKQFSVLDEYLLGHIVS